MVDLVVPEEEPGYLLQNNNLSFNKSGSPVERHRNTQLPIGLQGRKDVLDHVVQLAVVGHGPDGHRVRQLGKCSSKLGLPGGRQQLQVFLLCELVLHGQAVYLGRHPLQHGDDGSTVVGDGIDSRSNRPHVVQRLCHWRPGRRGWKTTTWRSNHWSWVTLVTILFHGVVWRCCWSGTGNTNC